MLLALYKQIIRGEDMQPRPGSQRYLELSNQRMNDVRKRKEQEQIKKQERAAFRVQVWTLVFAGIAAVAAVVGVVVQCLPG